MTTWIHRPGLYVSECTCGECESYREALAIGRNQGNALPRQGTALRCLNGHTWQSETLPGSTVPQTPHCPTCGGLYCRAV